MKPELKVIQGGAAPGRSSGRRAPASASATVTVLRLKDLAKVSPSLTRAVGYAMAEAASVVVESMKHAPPVRLVANVRRRRRDFDLDALRVTDAMRASHADEGRATEDGAYGVAILLAREVDSLMIVRKSVRGEGVDWWFTDDPNQPFQRRLELEVTHRVEVSGTTQDRRDAVRRRVTQKVAQSRRSDATRTPAIIIVVDFRSLRVTYKARA